MKQTEILTHATHVNGWFPAVYMSCMSQNFRLFHVSNLSVRNFRIFLLMYPGSMLAVLHRSVYQSSPFATSFGSLFTLGLLPRSIPPRLSLLSSSLLLEPRLRRPPLAAAAGVWIISINIRAPFLLRKLPSI